MPGYPSEWFNDATFENRQIDRKYGYYFFDKTISQDFFNYWMHL